MAAEVIPFPTPTARRGRLSDAEREDRAMSEKQLDARVMYRAKKYGWRAIHIQKAVTAGEWRTPTNKGFPDRVFFKAGMPIIFVELKRELGRVDEAQQEWLDLINSTFGAVPGARAVAAFVWRPSDLRLGIVERVLGGGTDA